ncbi:MAG: hypothetical protein ACTSRW_17050 [Candidatus Helarchaeota archaeon]
MTNCSDCKFFGGENDDGQAWCEKKQIYVGQESQQTCDSFENK